jgi:hypothetical protein
MIQAHIACRLRHMFRVPLLLALTSLCTPVWAIGPEAPVDFLDVYRAKGFMLMVIEPAQVVDIELMRIVHQDGEPLVREKVEWRQLRMLEYTAPITGPEHFQYRDPREKKPVSKPAAVRLPPIETARTSSDLKLAQPSNKIAIKEGPPRRVAVLIPLQTPAQAELKDGVYAEKFVARVRLAGEPDKSKPLTMLRWSHFLMQARKPRFISQAEYSRLVDAPVGGLNLGRDVKAEVPIDKTERSFAVPLQRGVTLVPEQDDSRPCEKTDKLCNEAQER